MKKKLNNISLLRLLMCIGIFIYHYVSFYITLDVGFYLPSQILVFVFAILSAFLYSNKNIDNPKSWIKKNFFKLFIPTITYIVISTLLLIIVGLFRYNFNFVEVFSNFSGVNPASGNPNFVFGNLWFLGILLICYLFTPICYKIINKSLTRLKTTLLILLIISISLIEILFNYFCPVFTVYICSYFIGRLIFKPLAEDNYNKSQLPLFFITSLIFILSSLTWYMWLGKVENIYIYGYSYKSV